MCCLLLTSCYFMAGSPPSVQTPRPSSIFTSPDCIAGCWNGLRPGTSTVEDVTARGFVHYADNHAYPLYTTSDANALFSPDDQLVSVEVYGPMDITFGQIIEVLGEPEYVSLEEDFGSEIPFLTARLGFYYPSHGWVFYSDSRGGITATANDKRAVTACVWENTLVVFAHLVEPGSLEDVLNAIDLPNTPIRFDSRPWERRRDFWQGFGCMLTM